MVDASIPPALDLLREVENVAADAAIVSALPHLQPHVQSAALDVLVERNHQSSIAAVVAAFHSYDPELRQLLSNRARDLHTGVRAAMSSVYFGDRQSAIELLQNACDAKSAYVLADALRYRCSRTRELAAVALQELATSWLQENLGVVSNASRRAGDERIAGIVAALKEAIETWEIHLQPKVLVASLWLGDLLEAVIKEKLQQPQTRIAPALTVILTSATDPRLAGAVLRGLAIPELRPACVRSINRTTTPVFIRALIEESWLITDPSIQHACRWIREIHWLQEWLDALSTLDEARASQALRFVAATAGEHEHRIELYRALLATDNAAVRRAVLRHLVEDDTEAATRELTTLAARESDEIGRIAADEVRRRGPVTSEQSATDENAATELSDESSDAFDIFFDRFDTLTSEQRHAAGEPLRRAPQYVATRLQTRLRGDVAAHRSRALRIARSLELAGLIDEEVFRLAHDPNPIVRAVAVAMLSELPGSTSIRILRVALNDPDSRVQANAIEALDALGLDAARDSVQAKLGSPNSRVRANAVKALLRSELNDAAESLVDMLDDATRAHRVSGLWVVRRLQLRTLLPRVADLAARDPDDRVKRYAQRVLDELSGKAEPSRAAEPTPPTPGIFDSVTRVRK